MLPGTLTQLCWRESACHRVVTSIYVAHLHSCRICAMGCENWGVLAGNVHTEIFGALESITPGMAQVVHTPHLPQGPPGSGPPVSFARSGITAAWDPKFASLLELAEACDVPVRWSCRTGVCHTCMTGLIGGSIILQP